MEYYAAYFWRGVVSHDIEAHRDIVRQYGSSTTICPSFISELVRGHEEAITTKEGWLK
tara:strand:+ start:4109 stop:4282 length:174 start_codon:yes stop_codon:yes gene_type:complete